jgi:hypothetical protein
MLCVEIIGKKKLANQGQEIQSMPIQEKFNAM